MKEKFYYSDFRLKDLCTPKYRHLLLLLYWPVFLLFFFGSKFFRLDYHEIHCAWDDMIPFCKWFIFPYVIWFVFLAFTALYTMAHDIPAFVKYQKYMILTGVIASLCYIVYPSIEYMRPETVPGNDPASLLVRLVYAADTPTNILPSEHVVDAFGVVFGIFACTDHRVSKPWFRAAVVIQAIVISASTVLVKQHSLLDVAAAVPLILLGWVLFFRKRKS